MSNHGRGTATLTHNPLSALCHTHTLKLRYETHFSLSLCSSFLMSTSSISESLSLLIYVPPCLLGESELCTLLLRPDRLRKATALLMRSLPLRSERDGVGGTILAGLLSAPESEDMKRAWTSAETDVCARGREPRSFTENRGSRQKSGGAEFLLLCFLRVASSSALKVAFSSE